MPEAIELYAGPGGISEALRALGFLDCLGFDADPAACATAEAAGHRRKCADVATLDPAEHGPCRVLAGAPPCQAWSMAGKRLGEADRAGVHALVDAYATGADDPGTGWADERSHHAAQPVRWVRVLRPEAVVLEQVPPVLPLWRHVGHVLRGWGYHVWTGVLNAANYGVPQTRERAILIASRTGPVGCPRPTHARRPAEDLLGGAPLPWVSMAVALGWAEVDCPARTVCGDRSPRWAYPQGDGSYRTGWTLQGNQRPNGGEEYQRREDGTPAQALTGNAGLYRWIETENRSEVGGEHVPYLRGEDRPAPTVVSNADRWQLHSRRDGPGWVETDGPREERVATEPAPTLTGEAARWQLIAGKQGKSTVRDPDEPAPTVAFGNDMASWRLRNGNQANACERDADEPAGTPFFGGRQNDVRFEDGTGPRRITVTEAAILQGFRPDYPWQGSKTKQFQQVGNATPPPLARAALAEALHIRDGPED